MLFLSSSLMSLLPAFTTLGAGPTVLMLHGGLGSHLSFAPQVETFAALGYRAVAWDMPGHGRSAPVEPYTFKALAQRCVALIESLHCGHVVLIGQGVGGMVAQEVVARRPELVSRLVLCATAAAGGDLGEPPAGPGGSALTPGVTLTPAQLADWQLPWLVGPAALPAGVQLARHCMLQLSPVIYERLLTALPAFDRRANLAHIQVPTLFVAGEHDRVTPLAGLERMAAAVAGSALAVIEGVGHLPPLEAPDAFDQAVLDFLRQPRHLH